MNKKIGDRRSILTILISMSIIISSFILVKAAIGGGFGKNHTVDPTIFTSRNLAVVDSPHSYNVEYAKGYLNIMKNFSDVTFKDLKTPTSYSTILKVGNVNDNIKAYKINDENIVIHLLGCDISNLACMFRINGVPTKRLYSPDRLLKKSSFNLNSDYELKINSIIFDYCDGARFCDLEHEAYHVVNVSIVRK